MTILKMTIMRRFLIFIKKIKRVVWVQFRNMRIIISKYVIIHFLRNIQIFGCLFDFTKIKRIFCFKNLLHTLIAFEKNLYINHKYKLEAALVKLIFFLKILLEFNKIANNCAIVGDL